eukprot:s1595_g8.t1
MSHPPMPPPSAPWPGSGMSNAPMVQVPMPMPPGPPMMQPGPPIQMIPVQAGKGAPAAPLPPGAPVTMSPFAVPFTMQSMPPTSSTTTTGPSSSSVNNLDPETKEFLDMARARQAELPPDMRQRVRNISKREGAKATKNFHSAVSQQGQARAALEEALQERSNLITNWRTFIQESVRTWQEYTELFQKQEADLQERIKSAQEEFASAKKQVDESKEEAGRVTVEILDTDDEALVIGHNTATNSAEKINDSLKHLTESLQSLGEQAAKIEVDEKAAKRPRTCSPVPNDQDMDGPVGGKAKAATTQHFA